MIQNTKNRNYTTFESGVMPETEREKLNIDWLKETYQSGYRKLFPQDKLNCTVNKTTGDWFIGIQRGMLDSIRVSFFYYNKTLFEVKIKHPERKIFKNDPLVYMMEIVSIIPFKDQKDWERVGFVEEVTTNDESIYLTDQLLDLDSIDKYDIKSMEKIIKEFFIEAMWRTIEKKPQEFNSVTIGFKEDK